MSPRLVSTLALVSATPFRRDARIDAHRSGEAAQPGDEPLGAVVTSSCSVR